MKENKSETPTRKGLLTMIREILGLKRVEIAEMPPVPTEETVERLIAKGSGDDVEKDIKRAGEEGCRCPYATKRAIVTSLNEIRAFAERHNLGKVMIRALLVLLAEMAIGAMKGKVSGRMLENLLKAVNYEAAVGQAYEDGELAGRNAKIRKEYFNEETDPLPDINGPLVRNSESDSFFDLAKQAK